MAVSRSLRWFAIFCGTLVAGMGAFALYLGPNVLAFLFHEERATAPFVMVNFVDFGSADFGSADFDIEKHAARERYFDGYSRPMLSLVAALGGSVVWQGAVKRVIEGRAEDHWDVLLMVRYPSRESFVSMMTSSEYRDLMSARSGALRRDVMVAATQLIEFPDTEQHASLMLLHRFIDEDARDRYHREYLPAQLESAKSMGGEVVWHALGNPLSADPEFAWNDVLILGFPTELQLSAWARQPIWRSRHALARPLMEHWALIELESSR